MTDRPTDQLTDDGRTDKTGNWEVTLPIILLLSVQIKNNYATKCPDWSMEM